MTIAGTIKAYLERQGIHYDTVVHPHTTSSLLTAETAHIDPRRIAKGVVLKDKQGYLLAVLPASRELDLHILENQIARRMALANEEELRGLFPDCQLGAVPALGPAYGLQTIVDESLATQPEICFEAGNHEELIRVSEQGFERLMGNSEFEYFSHRLDL
jgi:Ala-tRNA(Pro) deacylase